MIDSAINKTDKVFDLTPVLTPAAIFLSGILMSAALFFGLKGGGITLGVNTSSSSSSVSSAASSAATVSVIDLDYNGTPSPLVGNKDAGIYIVEFTDYQCTYCKRAFDQVLPEIKKNYLDTNKIAYVTKNFPLTSIHPYAQKSGVAVMCAEQQGKFSEMGSKLYANQDKLTDSDLKGYAQSLGLDMTKFNDCYDNDKTKDILDKDTTLATNSGVQGTPGFFLGLKTGDNKIRAFLVDGAYPYSVFDSLLLEIQKNGVDSAAKLFAQTKAG